MDKAASAQLPGTWGLPRSVKLERIPGQSLGISIVGKHQTALVGGLLSFVVHVYFYSLPMYFI